MERSINDRCRRQAKVFKALGHPTRLFLVQELGHSERCVCDLQQLVGSDISTVSKHLSVLREAGLVRDDRRGNQVFYQLNARCVLDFLGCIDSLQSEDPQAILAAPPATETS